MLVKNDNKIEKRCGGRTRYELQELSVFRHNYLRVTCYKSIDDRAIGGSKLSAGTRAPDQRTRRRDV